MSQNKLRGYTQIQDNTIKRQQISEALFVSGASVFIDLEDHSAECDSTKTDFTLTSMPLEGTIYVYLRGTLRRPGPSAVGGEFSVSANVITFYTAPETGDDLLISYRKAV